MAPEDPNSLMNDPINGSPDAMPNNPSLDATLNEDDQLLQDLKKRLRSEMMRNATASQSSNDKVTARPASGPSTRTATLPSSSLPASLPSALAAPRSPYATDLGGTQFTSAAPASTNLPPVDVSSAFPALSEPGNAPTLQLPEDQSELPTTPTKVSPKRYLPVLPNSVQR